MRRIDNIVIHCTATPLTTKVESIQAYWQNVLGWSNPGYHIIIRADGTHQRLAPDSSICNGVRGHNAHSLHISYIGGRMSDDRTEEQKIAMIILLRQLKQLYPAAQIKGHRDFPGVSKACPNFDVKKWLEDIGF